MIPSYALWVFDPHENQIRLEDTSGQTHATKIDHQTLGRGLHESRIHGYAYRIHHGWRITDWEHYPVEDPHVKEMVAKTLREKYR